MKTIVFLRKEKCRDSETIRFTSINTPPLLVGDTFQLPRLFGICRAKVTERHWFGIMLLISCTTDRVLFNHLFEKATKLAESDGVYELPNQNWADLCLK